MTEACMRLHVLRDADISASPIGPSQDEIDKVVAEEKVRAEIKAAKAKAAADAKAKAASETSSADKDGKDSKDETSKDVKRPTLPISSGSGPSSPGPSPSTPTGTHKKFALHRGIFAMRQNEKKRREQGTQAKAISKGELHSQPVLTAGMPQVPRGAF